MIREKVSFDAFSFLYKLVMSLFIQNVWLERSRYEKESNSYIKYNCIVNSS